MQFEVEIFMHLYWQCCHATHAHEKCQKSRIAFEFFFALFCIVLDKKDLSEKIIHTYDFHFCILCEKAL